MKKRLGVMPATGKRATLKNYEDPAEECATVRRRVLMFQQRDILHREDDILQGVKYTKRIDLIYKLEAKDGDLTALRFERPSQRRSHAVSGAVIIQWQGTKILRPQSSVQHWWC